jgi:hypothetical protein
MDDKNKNAISKVFEDRESQKKRSEDARSARLAKEAEDREKFKKLREDVIKPASQEIVDFLTEKGQVAHVVERNPSFNKDSGQTIYSIDICLFSKDESPKPMSPRFSCIYDESRGTVRFHGQTANASGPYGGTIGLAQVTKASIQDQFTDWFAKPL